ncbi:replication restart helicase PriA [Alistipes finegoldii]|uniref:replication restart helicase PriA n=1 Tax=Alistipes finegoldii TaxID=214856 RepID=UPI003AB45C14
MPLYADIVLPLAQPAYTFAVPEGMHVAEGTAVAVQFGPRKFYTGVVWRVHDRRPPFRTIKSIQRVLYDAPLLSAQQKALWEWIAAYYMCSAGEVMRVALPSLMKPSGDTEEEFAEDEFRPRTECYVALARELHDEGRLHEVFEKLGRRAPKQYEALLEIASAGDETRISTGEVARRLLRADYAALHALERKGHIVCTERERTVERGGSAFRLPELTAPQREALGSLREQFAEKPAALLHGVTGSGKTEIYIHLIAETLARGGDVLLLVPEIALTAQLIGRMERIFGSRVTPYHSKLTNRRRTETYLRLNRSQGGEFVVGVRSSIFLPLKHLQLIIVDEEHDASYKQADPAPRYNARDCAVVMARLWGGRTLLGSATPSLETWLNAEGGKYGRAVLAERYGDARPPEIFVSDTIRAAKRGERHAHFNKLLLDKMEETLGRGEQVMLFQNRRGFSPYVECSQCGWTARCPHCNVTLTYHKGGARLVCHYCGYTVPVPAKCPSCEVTEVLPRGFGTEKVEEEIARLFPEARVARLDRDSVTSERAFNAIISDFEARKTDILVGTQMITKGFDFGGVSLVGILNADNLLNNPDFRAAERAFQLMLQVAGRAGRRSDGGEVVIQTSEPGHPVIRQVVAGDFAGMARMQLSERKAFFYPPYARLTSLTLRHRDVALLRRGVTELAARLRVRFGRRVLGPMTPPVDRIRGEYLAGLLLKIESGASSAKARALLAAELKAFAENPEFKTITFICNVDPQ